METEALYLIIILVVYVLGFIGTATYIRYQAITHPMEDRLGIEWVDLLVPAGLWFILVPGALMVKGSLHLANWLADILP